MMQMSAAAIAGEFSLKPQGCGIAAWDAFDPVSQTRQQELSQLLQDAAKKWFAAKAHLHLIHLQKPPFERYCLVEFFTEQHLRDHNKLMKREQNFTLQYLFLPYNSAHPVIYSRPQQTDPFFGMQLPPYSEDSFFVVWRCGAEIKINCKSTRMACCMSLAYEKSHAC